jgi:hypothetical protein
MNEAGEETPENLQAMLVKYFSSTYTTHPLTKSDRKVTTVTKCETCGLENWEMEAHPKLDTVGGNPYCFVDDAKVHENVMHGADHYQAAIKALDKRVENG